MRLEVFVARKVGSLVGLGKNYNKDASGHKALRLEYDRHKYVKFAFFRPRKF